MCTKNDMMYSFWHVECNKQIFFHFGSFFPNIWKYYPFTINEDHMIYGSWNIMCNTKFVVTLGHFLLFSPCRPRKSKFWKIKKITGDVIILHVCTITDKHVMYAFSFFVILHCFLPFYPPDNPENLNIGKMKKNTWRYAHFTNVYHKWQSYDVWFLRYWVGQTDFFPILGHFLPFYRTKNLQNQNFEKLKKTYHFTNVYHEWQSYHIWFLRYGVNEQTFLSFCTVFCPCIP